MALAAHALILAAVWQTFPKAVRMFEPAGVTVELVRPPPPEPPAPQPAPEPKPSPPKASAKRSPEPPKPAARPIKVAVRARVPDALPASPAPQVQAPTELTDAEVAGAATAGSGSGTGGGSCDMIRRLQEALRHDRGVIEAVARTHRAAGGRGAAIMVWNGDWVRSGSEDGKGLAGVRQAIAVEVAFAPEACRALPVRGLVLISLTDAPGSAKLALGAGRWRWSDLLFAR
jgi:outer membrane biosynthesis protein TonB